MASFILRNWITNDPIRTITGDSFSRAIEAEVLAGRSLANADLRQLGKNGEPTGLNLAGGTFTSANFDDARLVNAILIGADLTNASMKRTDQRGSKQKNVTATGVVETDAVTTGRDGR